MTIAAPNGTQPIWSSNHTVPGGTAKVSIAFSKSMPSSLILPVVPGVSVPTPLPPCPSLRNEPCRAYVPITNRVAAVTASRRTKHKARPRKPSRRRRGDAGFTA